MQKHLDPPQKVIIFVSMSNKIVTCKSCNNQFTGSYCNICGEKVINQEDKRFKYFIGEFINAISFADSKFWRTLRSIMVDPGSFSKNFIEGRRKKFMRPISLFLFANMIYFIFPLFNTFHSSLGSQISTHNFLHSELANELVQDKIEKKQISIQEFEVLYNAKTAELSKVFLILIVIIFAIFNWVLHNPNKHFLSDQIVLSLELMTFIILFGVQLQGIIMNIIKAIGFGSIISEFLLTLIAGLLLLYFLIRSEISFFESKKIPATLHSILGLVCFSATLYIYRAFLFFITFWSI